MTRKIVYGYNVSLDGFIEDRDGTIEWTEPGPELHRWFNESERDTDLQMYGRRLWETMKVWEDMLGDETLPPEMQEYAELWNRTPTVVFSRTLAEAPPGVQLFREVDADQIRRLKAEPGGDFSIGGATVAAEFLRLGLVDEVMVAIHPVILGGGKKRMIPELADMRKLTLVESKVLDARYVALRYTVQA
jgi:dihydrofolate reductase